MKKRRPQTPADDNAQGRDHDRTHGQTPAANRAGDSHTNHDQLEDRIDELLDGDLSHTQMRRAYDEICACPDARNELASLRMTVARLHTPIQTPDLTESILNQVGLRRRFLRRDSRRFVMLGKAAVAAGVVVTVALTALTQHAHPELSPTKNTPAPVSQIVESAQQATPNQAALLSDTVKTIQSSIVSPIARLSLDRKLHPENSYRFDIVLGDGQAYWLPSSARGVLLRPQQASYAQRGQPPAGLQTVAAGVHGHPYIAPTLLGPISYVPQQTTNGARQTLVRADSALLPFENPFIKRFDSLLVVLRDPTLPLADKDQPGDNER